MISSERIRIMRKILLSCIVGSFYVWFLYLIVSGEIAHLGERGMPVLFTVFLFLCGCILFLNMRVIDFQYNKWRSFWVFLLLYMISLIRLYTIWAYETSTMTLISISLFCFHGWFAVIYESKAQRLCTCRVFMSRPYMITGIASSSFFIALGFALLSAATWHHKPLSCDELYEKLEQWAWRLASPLFLGAEAAGSIKTEIENFSQVTIGEVMGVDDEDIALLSGELSRLAEIEEESAPEGSVLAFVSTWKTFITDEIVSEKEFINEGICETIIQQIQKKSSGPLFSYSAAVLLFFLLYPLIKILLFMVSAVSLLIFELLKLAKIYTREKKQIRTKYIV